MWSHIHEYSGALCGDGGGVEALSEARLGHDGAGPWVGSAVELGSFLPNVPF